METLAFQVRTLPDLSLNKYQSLSDTGIEGVLARHESFLRLWHGICSVCGANMHLLYVLLPNEEAGSRLKLFFLLSGSSIALSKLPPLLSSSTLSEFFSFFPVELPEVAFNSAATLVKKERIAGILNPVSGELINVHYVPRWETNAGARLYDLFKIMQTVSELSYPAKACAFRIDLFPSSMEQETRAAFEPVIKSLRGENDLILVDNASTVGKDDYAKSICKEYEDWLLMIDSAPHFRVNIYAFANELYLSKILLNAAGAEAVKTGDYSIASIKEDASGGFSLTSRLEDKPSDYCFFPHQAKLPSWSTTYSLEETAPFFRFPVLFDGENIEIPKETSPIQFEDGIFLGQNENGFPVYFPLNDISRHAFFTGMPGSGKTNSMLHLVTELKKRDVPFLVLEPAKKEYRALLTRPEMKDVYLFSPHISSRFPLHVNPLEFPSGVRLSEHINALLEVFEGSFPLEGPTYFFLSKAIQSSYFDLGWALEDINDENCTLPWPTLQTVFANLQKEIEQSGYDGELKGNIQSFLQVRLGSLMERDSGELFNVPLSTIAPKEWISTSAIVELETLGEHGKNFFILLICHYLIETMHSVSIAVQRDSSMPPIRHVVFIEEAHNIISQTTHQQGTDSIDPKVSATAYLVKMLAEVRALREGMVIADQLPTALAPEITKNTGLKIVHRLTAKDDREIIGTAISASSLQTEQIASLSTGYAFIHHEKTMKPFQVKIAKWEREKEFVNISDDEELYELLKGNAPVRHITKAAIDCWRYKYEIPFERKVIKLQEKYLCLSATDKAGIAIFQAEKGLLIQDATNLQKKWASFKAQIDPRQEDIAKYYSETQEEIEQLTNRISKMKTSSKGKE